jgi:hypothetical protein
MPCFWLQAEVMPAVTDALRMMCAERPEEPLRFLANHLLAAAAQV